MLKFYTAFAIFCMGDRFWTFLNAFLFELLGGMRLVSLDQFLESFSSMFLSTWVGNWLDVRDRRRGAMAVLVANNLALVLSAILLGICVLIEQKGTKSPLLEIVSIFSLVGAIAFSSMAKCSADGERLVFTKDWVVVLAKSADAREKAKEKERSGTISKKNATLVIIDQFASVLGPLIAGFLLACFGHLLICAIVVGWNLLALFSIKLMLKSVYNEVPELAEREQKEVSSQANGQENIRAKIEIKCIEVEGHDKKNGNQENSAQNENKGNAGKCYPFVFLRPMFASIRTYYGQSVFPAAFGLALLYATVLGFDGLAVSFGKAQGMRDEAIGTFRSVSSILGLMGAVTFAPAEKGIGLKKTGLLGLSAQHLCLWLCVLSIWLPGSPFDPFGYFREWTFGNWLHSSKMAFEKFGNSTIVLPKEMSSNSTSIFVFFIGLTLSRFGLWLADLAIIQLMQLGTPEAERGTVFGVQNGFSQLFSMLKDVLAILLPDPRTFGLLIIFSIFCVGFGFLQYIHFMRKTKKNKKKQRI